LKVAVIGSSGGMGRLFVRYFLSRGSEVTGFDPQEPTLTTDPGFRSAQSNEECVRGSSVVVIAAPLEKTVETVSSVAEALGRGTTLVEITSVKGKILPELKRKLRGRGIHLLSLHPLFGPSLVGFAGMRICVVETEKSSVTLARDLFPDARLIPMDESEHDRTMGLILSATHLLNIAYAGLVSKYLTVKEFREVQTPTSGVQLTLAEGILSQNPSLYSYIQLENDHSAEFVAELIDELTQMLRYIEEKDVIGFETRFRELSRTFAGDSRDALDLVYQAFERPTGR
jgi:prephenate dehydrogenase